MCFLCCFVEYLFIFDVFECQVWDFLGLKNFFIVEDEDGEMYDVVYFVEFVVVIGLFLLSFLKWSFEWVVDFWDE